MTETEIKLRVESPARVRAKLREMGWRAAGRRQHEQNLVFDRADHALLAAGYLLRVRRVGKQCRLTVKCPGRRGGRHKVREEFEIETRGGDGPQLVRILEVLGFRVAWRYEKFRTEFRRAGLKDKILLDLTPVGDFLELEGRPQWIDRMARKLGFSRSDYITQSYRELFLEYQHRHGDAVRDMVFGDPALLDRPK